MTSFTIETLGLEGDPRVDERLAGRTVWCVAALPTGRRRAGSLQEALGPATARRVDLTADEPLVALARRLEAMLERTSASAPLDAGDTDLYATGAAAARRVVGPGVAAQDVVVLHDVLSCVLAQALRQRGAHAVWDLGDAARADNHAWDFLHGFTAGMDAYVTSRPRAMAAVMPASDAVTARSAGAWPALIADVVHGDRHEHVGGTLQARPAVAAR